MAPNADPYELAMFPLGSVLFTSMVLPLHLFEPRYLKLAEDVLGGGREFGVVLIERGSEVGGGEVRSSVGTVAQVLEEHQFDDGRWALGSVGTRRIRVVEWLEDAPYPRAMVVDFPEVTEFSAPEMVRDTLADCESQLRRAVDRLVRLGEVPAGVELEISEDPALASHQISALGPFGPSDRQDLLSCDGAAERLELLDGLLDDAIAMLDFRLAE